VSGQEALSSDEVAALVSATRQGAALPGAADGRRRRRRRVREIDFSRPTKFTQEQQRRLERAHDDFCRLAATRLSAELRLAVDLQVIGIDQVTWSSAIADLPEPSISAIVHTSPLDTQLLMALELGLALRLIDRLLGGEGTARPRPIGLTEIDLSLARRIFAALLDQLSVTWQEVAGLTLSLGESLETKAVNLHLAPASEPTLRLSIEVKLGRHSSTISLIVPYRAIEPIAGRLAGGQFGDAGVDPVQRATVRAAVAGVEVELRAEAAAVDLTLDDVLALEPGSIVPLGPASAATLYIGDVAMYRVRPGRNGGRRAVEVLERRDGGA
jgi:flagellar motor switch protein FliM